jgi:hypothetical protein
MGPQNEETERLMRHALKTWLNQPTPLHEDERKILAVLNDTDEADFEAIGQALGGRSRWTGKRYMEAFICRVAKAIGMTTDELDLYSASVILSVLLDYYGACRLSHSP